MALTPGPSPAGRGGSGSRRGDGRNMLRPYGLAATYSSQLLRVGSGTWTMGEEGVGVGGGGEGVAEGGFIGGLLLFLHAGGLPGEAGQEIEQAAQVLGRVLDAPE